MGARKSSAEGHFRHAGIVIENLKINRLCFVILVGPVLYLTDKTTCNSPLYALGHIHSTSWSWYTCWRLRHSAKVKPQAFWYSLLYTLRCGLVNSAQQCIVAQRLLAVRG